MNGTQNHAREGQECDGQNRTPDEVETPAAHIRTQAPIEEVREEVETKADLVSITLSSDNISALLLRDPEEARALADALETAAQEAETALATETSHPTPAESD